MGEERFTVTYRIAADDYEEAKSVAGAIPIEQSIEFPYEFVTNEYIKDVITGRLESLDLMDVDSVYAAAGILPCGCGKKSYFIARVTYPMSITAYEATQLLNVVFGNSSLQPHIWVADIELPDSAYTVFKGPRYGLRGIRQLVHTPHRAMIQAVIKPMGTRNEDLAGMCAAYTKGGADVIKDDHGITNQPFSQFKDRVLRCADAVRTVNEQSGRHTLYAANVSGDGTDVIDRAYYAKEAGASALMIAPGLTGFGWLHKLASDPALGLPVICHPAFGGGHVMPGISGVADYLWLGLFPRLFGGDMPIFVSYGGRFTFTEEQCKRIAGYIRRPMEKLKSACPSPGGGIADARLDELVKLYGNDTMFLVGGDMFRRGPDIASNMAYFVERLEGLSR